MRPSIHREEVTSLPDDDYQEELFKDVCSTAMELCVNMTEEVGELAHAHLKGHNKIRGQDDTEMNRHYKADSLGDLFIYMGRDLWLNKQRWNRLVRQYLDPVETERFLFKAGELGRGQGAKGAVTTMFCHNVAREAKKHRWGNCMLGFTYRGDARKGTPTLSLHSRVSYIAYIGGLDLALAHVLARRIGEDIGIAPEDFAFRWHVDALQFHASSMA